MSTENKEHVVKVGDWGVIESRFTDGTYGPYAVTRATKTRFTVRTPHGDRMFATPRRGSGVRPYTLRYYELGSCTTFFLVGPLDLLEKRVADYHTKERRGWAMNLLKRIAPDVKHFTDAQLDHAYEVLQGLKESLT